MSDILQLPGTFKDPPPPNQIYEVKRYEDDKGRVIVTRDPGDGVLQFWGNATILIQNVGQLPLNFPIAATDIYDAFDKCEAAGKKAYDAKIKEIEAEQRRQSILQSATQPFKHPRNGSAFR